MRIRVVLSGIVSAAICVIALWFPWYMMEPANIAPDWAYVDEAAILPAWLSTGMLVFCGLTLFAFGWVSARWNWAGNWRDSLLAGAGAGLIAGCLIYDFIGTFHFGLSGQEAVLRAFYTEVDDVTGLTLFVDSITETATQLYFNFLLTVAACALLSAMGGLASAVDAGDTWGRPPRAPDSWLFRIPAYSLTLTGCLWMIVTIAAFSVLQEVVIDAVVENELSGLNSFPVLISFSAYSVGWVLIFLPMSVTWGWLLRSWRSAGL